ncbi:MAG: transglutaminase domain-containing protein [Candidatus Omnitrophica bacterium]|nr:transglutaminase domain-containing protein [Candidatus Omnitrophota bacterium]
MKNFVTSIRISVFCAALFTMMSGAEAHASFFSQPVPSLQNLSSELTTPEKIARYLWRHFAYEKDQTQFGAEEYWQSAEEFLANRRGDCEDFALLASALLQQAGRTAFTVNIYGSGYAHTICVYIEDGKYSAIDGSDLKKFQADNLEGLLSAIHSDWSRAAITALSEETRKGRILKLIPNKKSIKNK